MTTKGCWIKSVLNWDSLPPSPEQNYFRGGRNICISPHKGKIKRKPEKKKKRCVYHSRRNYRMRLRAGRGVPSPFVFLSLSLSCIEINVCPKFMTTGTDWMCCLIQRDFFLQPRWPLLFLKFDCSHCCLIFCKWVEDSKAFPPKLNNSVKKD